MNTDDATHEKHGFVDMLKEHSLKAAGYAYLVGDAAIIASGLLDKNKTPKEKYQRAAVGAAWGLGGLAAARYGNPTAEKQLELLCNRLGDYLRMQGVVIPDRPELADIAKEGGLVHHVQSFMYAHPSEVLNTIYVLGSAQLVTNGLLGHSKANANAATLTADEMKKAKRVAHSDTASGLFIGAGALAGLLIPEKTPDPTHPAQGSLGRAMAWVQEKPLRVSGLLYHANNASMLWGAFAARGEKGGNKNYLWRFLTAGSYIFGNTMLALSSKNFGKDNKDPKMLEKLSELSAQVIAAQPKDVQEALVQQISGYLGAQPEIEKHAKEIAQILHAKLAAVSQSAAGGLWTDAVSKSPGELSPTL